MQARQAIAVAPDNGLDVVGGYARAIAGATAQTLFGISGQDNMLFRDVARAIFAHTFLNLGGDKTIEARALKAAALMGRWFEDEIANRRRSGKSGDDMMGWLLKDRLVDDDGVRRTLGGMLVGSIDTTATAVAQRSIASAAVAALPPRSPRRIATVIAPKVAPEASASRMTVTPDSAGGRAARGSPRRRVPRARSRP